MESGSSQKFVLYKGNSVQARKVTRDKDDTIVTSWQIAGWVSKSTDETAEPEYRLGNHQERDNWIHHNGLDLLGTGL